MKLLVDMNLSPAWVDVFQAESWESRHWSTTGNPSASDREIIDWAAHHGFVIVTHDLDFGSILARQGRQSPSVVQIRGQEVLPAAIGSPVIAAIRRFEPELDAGALVTIDAARSRARILPLR